MDSGAGSCRTSRRAHRVHDRGKRFAYRYHESEKEDYRRGMPIYRDWDEVGRRDFFAWHPPQYVRRVLLSGLEEVEYSPSEDSGLNQDLWLARVPLAVHR